MSLQHPPYNLVHFYIRYMKWVYILFLLSARYAILVWLYSSSMASLKELNIFYLDLYCGDSFMLQECNSFKETIQ